LIRAECEKCGKIVEVPDHFAGGEGKCKRCGWRVYIPRPGESGRPARPSAQPAGGGGHSGHAGAAAMPADRMSSRRRAARRNQSNTGLLVAAWMVVILLIVLVGVAIYAAKWHQAEVQDPTNVKVRPSSSGMVRPPADDRGPFCRAGDRRRRGAVAADS